MARRTRREVEIADHLWDCLTRIAEDCGTDRNAVVNQALYEFARRMNFLTPRAEEVPAPRPSVGPAGLNGPTVAPDVRRPYGAQGPKGTIRAEQRRRHA